MISHVGSVLLLLFQMRINLKEKRAMFDFLLTMMRTNSILVVSLMNRVSHYTGSMHFMPSNLSQTFIPLVDSRA